MDAAIVPVSEIERKLITATKPAESKAVEVVAAAAKAWAKEQGDYETFVEAARIYILARRKTTELIKPQIERGGNGSNQYESKGNNDVTLADFNFTKMQWNRRVKELSVSSDDVDAYFDECITNHWEPTVYGLLRFVSNPHISFNAGENEWYTPPEYIISACAVMGRIDLDPASSETANQVIGAAKFYGLEDDGLSKIWAGRVWLNPPYSNELITPFISKYAQHVNDGDITEGIVLVNNATETKWFKELVGVSNAVVFPSGRVRFLDPQGNPGAPLQGQAVVYAGKNTDKFIAEFSKFGWCAELC